jgi:hypothetical protein
VVRVLQGQVEVRRQREWVVNSHLAVVAVRRPWNDGRVDRTWGDPWGPFLTSPQGANFHPQGRSCPPGVKLSPGGVRPSILLNSRECLPLGVNEGVNIPLGDKCHPWGPGEKLRMTLCWRPFKTNGQISAKAFIRKWTTKFISKIISKFLDFMAPKNATKTKIIGMLSFKIYRNLGFVPCLHLFNRNI